MPYIHTWQDPEVFLEHGDTVVYHVYEEDRFHGVVSLFLYSTWRYTSWYTANDDETDVFDVFAVAAQLGSELTYQPVDEYDVMADPELDVAEENRSRLLSAIADVIVDGIDAGIIRQQDDRSPV
jgi:hypothetical protein